MVNPLPDSNNVYSTIAAPVNIALAEHVLKTQFPDAKVWTYRSGYNGATTIHVESDEADFEGYPTSDEESPDYLFNGVLAGEDSQVIAKVESILKSFENAGFTMTIEAYDAAEELICGFKTNRSESGPRD